MYSKDVYVKGVRLGPCSARRNERAQGASLSNRDAYRQAVLEPVFSGVEYSFHRRVKQILQSYRVCVWTGDEIFFGKVSRYVVVLGRC